MLKAYDVTELRAGMKVGQAVKSFNGQVVVKKNVLLTSDIIERLQKEGVFMIYIDVTAEDYKATNAAEDHLIDTKYMDCYRACLNCTQNLYYGFANSGKLEKDELMEILRVENISELCDDGAKSITQMINMKREGDYLIHHALNIGILSGIMAGWMNYKAAQVGQLMMSGLLSEIGKMKISKGILNKVGKLDDEDFAEIKKHVVYGYKMLMDSPIRNLRDVTMGVLHHHERCDGSGYPSGLRGKEISDFGKIIAILDIYDAMATNRPNAKRHSPFEIIKVIYNDIIGGKLDTRFGVIFIKNFLQALNGCWVGLSDGQRAKIVYIDDSRLTNLPIVQTNDGEIIDLNTKKSLTVDVLLTVNEL
ncbi:MAG: HD domain-containing protein [Selenomonadaceae bacterium]|nr:HD domain-containing protein [Selenomonadaceae bacterium]